MKKTISLAISSLILLCSCSKGQFYNVLINKKYIWYYASLGVNVSYVFHEDSVSAYLEGSSERFVYDIKWVLEDKYPGDEVSSEKQYINVYVKSTEVKYTRLGFFIDESRFYSIEYKNVFSSI